MGFLEQIMPIYEYLPSGDRRCPFCRDGFELLQKIEDPEVDACPECSAPVARKISAANVARQGPSLDAANIEKHGFTQYRKSGKGVYEKTAGKGPDTIKSD